MLVSTPAGDSLVEAEQLLTLDNLAWFDTLSIGGGSSLPVALGQRTALFVDPEWTFVEAKTFARMRLLADPVDLPLSPDVVDLVVARSRLIVTGIRSQGERT